MPKWDVNTLQSVLGDIERQALLKWLTATGISTGSVERLQLRLAHLRSLEHPPMINRWDEELLARLFDALRVLEAEDVD